MNFNKCNQSDNFQEVIKLLQIGCLIPKKLSVVPVDHIPGQHRHHENKEKYTQ